MTSQYINSIEDLINTLTKDASSYYIEEKAIASKEEVDGHLFYSRYKQYNGKITKTLLKQHLNKDINLAISLKEINYLAYEYSGKHKDAFVSLLHHFIKEYIKETNVYITTLENSKIVIVIDLNSNKCVDITSFKKNIDKKLKERLITEFKTLPNNSNPHIGNLLKLPREFIPFNK